MRRQLYILFILLQSTASLAQTERPGSDSLCSLISTFHKDQGYYCIYDTIALVETHIKNKPAIFAIRSVDVDGTNTPFAEIFVMTKGKLLLVRTDTLITTDCNPCQEPREFNGVSVRIKNGKKQVLLACSYFYLRHGLAGTVYRTFVYEFRGNPIKISRNPDSEEEFKSANVGEIDGE